ncbi:hypothetical protein LTR36_001084 [Oleoguttula mirabilis]|uniref:Trafficking protein particle complex subunit 11 n=1 Tax=Oleoguttula mirabilis TaxID=1507867 RepID=A0AAV9JPX6_9PEZI|nr:hypothetical protein LTR36_001084 [Oleoguttula mirabilis]
MEAYPGPYVQHDSPLVFLSGLGERPDENRSGTSIPRQESGTRIVTASAECEGDRATQLLDKLLGHDGSQRAWNSAAQSGPKGGLRYRMKPIGRTFTLPPRKAAPSPQSPSADGLQSQHRSTELHSPLSPLSPGSPIYPDGVFTPLWVAKHQEHVPALLIAFFSISTDDTSTSRNEQIQIDINAIRTALGRSGFKTKFAAVILSDTSILHAPELEDRLSAIRRATTLDLKTGLFFMPPMSSQAEIATFVDSLLTPLQPLVLDYYRDLTRHNRRKKARGGATAESGVHTLSTPGWNVRYEVKQGVFAEFRQEMDVAERHYSQAIEDLFSSDGILEATPSWSPRWSEARLLCDILAFRTLRCQLFSGLTTGAAVSWVNYRARVKDLVDRRGVGSQTYGFDAWESRWAEIMAQLLEHAALPVFQSSAKQAPAESTELQQRQIFAPLDKGISAADRTPPFHQLHHRAYWLRLAFQSARARLGRALEIPEEDRTPPSRSPASSVAQRSKKYDTYLVPEPDEEYPFAVDKGYNHITTLRRLAMEAAREFSIRGQARSAQHIRLDLAHQVACTGGYSEALDILTPVWEDATWRDEEWDDVFSSLLYLLHDCATHVNNAELRLATTWELLAVGSHPPAMGDREFSDYVGHSQHASEKVAVKFENRQRLSPVTVSFAFVDKDTRVGELVECQLTVRSHASDDSAPITLSRVEVMLSSSTTIVISHKTSASPILETETLLDLSEAASGDVGYLDVEADLTLHPSQSRICSLFLNFREAGVVRLQQACLVVENDTFCLEHTYTDEDLMRTASVRVLHDSVLQRRLLPHSDTTAVTVLPKPPKMLVSLHQLRKHYYANECIRLELELVNEESESVDAIAALHVSGDTDDAVTVGWDSEQASQGELALGNVAAAVSVTAGLTVEAPAEPCTFIIDINISYTLASDPSTSLTKTLTTELEITVPFEAKYELAPLLQPGPWPSYFDAGDYRNAAPEGVALKWRLGTPLHSSAADSIVIRNMELVIDSVAEDATCNLSDHAFQKEQVLSATQSAMTNFEFVTRMRSLDNRSAANVELSLVVTWSREGDSAKVTASLPVPRLTLPSSEPRVLCTLGDGPAETDTLVLDYHLENPSMHFLTFAVTMESSEAFAFAGPKYRALSLAPLSRLRLQYHLLLHDQQDETDVQAEEGEGCWIWPVLSVVDSYYQKNLRVHAGSARIKVDEKRGLGVLVSDL